MFVGRVIPNKKFEDVIRAFHAYRTRHNPRSRLLLVGSYSGFERYLAMLHALIARLGTPDVHFLGHVSNEELTALYDVADLFLCASEHEGFCVPIIESVLQAACRCSPTPPPPCRRRWTAAACSTTRRIPFEIARLMAAILDDRGSGGRGASTRRTPRSAGCAPGTSAARCCASSTRCVAAGRATPPEVAWDFWAQFDQFERLEELRQFRPALYRALPETPADRGSGSGTRDRRSEPGSLTTRAAGRAANHRSGPRIPDPGSRSPIPAHDHQPVGAGGASRGRDRRQRARRCAACCARRGHQSDLFALTMDDDLRGDVRPFADPAARRGDVTIFHFALPSPMTAAFARAAGRARAAVPQHHAGGLLRALRPGLFRLAALGRQELQSLAGHGRPRARRLRVQPPGARGARLRADRRAADRRQHRADHRTRRAGPRWNGSSATA